MKSLAQISIITPVFNGARFIEEAAQSVLSQTISDWEWIIINDGSTDDTSVLLESFDDTRIKVVHQANAGVSAARNCGLGMANGSYITFLDADDLLPPEALELRATFLDANPDVDIVNGGIRVTSKTKDVRQYDPSCVKSPLFDRLAQLDEGVFFGPFYMLRKSSIRNHRFPIGVTHCEDLIFFLSLAHDSDLQYGAIPEIIYEYRLHDSSAMSNLEGIERGYMALLRIARRLPKLDAHNTRIMKRQITSILVKSWIRKGRPDRAALAAFQVYRHSHKFS